jgi:hypothetical protein
MGFEAIKKRLALGARLKIRLEYLLEAGAQIKGNEGFIIF